jgi:methylated-DNA-protein-cysteine methyltransferase-like protein
LSKSEDLQAAIRRTIRAIPRGKVATYGQVAEAAGYPRFHRQVAQILGKYGDALPWHRVIGSGGVLKTSAESKFDQRLRLEMEGVHFRGARVDMRQHQNVFEPFSEKPRSPRRRT